MRLLCSRVTALFSNLSAAFARVLTSLTGLVKVL